MCNKYYLRIVTLAVALLLPFSTARAINSYSPATGLVIVDSIIVGDGEFKNAVIQPEQLISYSTLPPTSTVNMMDWTTGQLTLYAVTVGTTIFSNVIITVKNVVSSEPSVIPIIENTKIRGSAYIPHCANGASLQPCLELVIENAETLHNVCNSFLLNWRRKQGSLDLCPIDQNFDWQKNRLAIIYSSLEDYYINHDQSIYSYNVDYIISALEYSDHWLLGYTLMYPSQLTINVEFNDYLGNIQAIPIPNDGKSVSFIKYTPYFLKSQK